MFHKSYFKYSRTPLNGHLGIAVTPVLRPLLSPVLLLLGIIMIQKYGHPDITAIYFGPKGDRNSEVPLCSNFVHLVTCIHSHFHIIIVGGREHSEICERGRMV